MAGVEGQENRRRLGSHVLEVVGISHRDHHDVAGRGVEGLRLASRRDDGPAETARDHVIPLDRVGVPVRLPHPARLQVDDRARHAGRGGKMVDDHLPLVPAAVSLQWRFGETELEGRGRADLGGGPALGLRGLRGVDHGRGRGGAGHTEHLTASHLRHDAGSSGCLKIDGTRSKNSTGRAWCNPCSRRPSGVGDPASRADRPGTERPGSLITPPVLVRSLVNPEDGGPPASFRRGTVGPVSPEPFGGYAARFRSAGCFFPQLTTI